MKPWTLIPEFDELLEKPLTTGKTIEQRYDELLQLHAADQLSEAEREEFARLMNELEDR